MHWALQKQKGFTIVELLIVVVVIAILAAITIVSYNGISNRAKQSAAASLVSQSQKKLALYAAANNDQYPATLADAGVDASTAANLQYSVNTGGTAGFCLTATQSGASVYLASSYSYTAGTPQVLTQASPTGGACPGHVQNGVVAANNLILNPAVRVNNAGWSAVASSGGAQGGTRVTSVSGLSAVGVNGITTAYRNTLGGNASTWWRVQYSPVPVTGEVTYTFSGYIRPSVTTQTGAIIIWENSSGTIVESASGFSSQTGGTWARRSVTATAPATATSVRLQLAASGGGVAGSYLDGVAAMFYAGSALPAYADGATTDWIWEGAADASTSRGPAQ